MPDWPRGLGDGLQNRSHGFESRIWLHVRRERLDARLTVNQVPLACQVRSLGRIRPVDLTTSPLGRRNQRNSEPVARLSEHTVSTSRRLCGVTGMNRVALTGKLGARDRISAGS